MRDRRPALTREEAIQAYLVCQIRMNEFLHILQIELDICHGKYRPENRRHQSDEFLGTLATARAGFFASLMDPNRDSIDIFDVWLTLLPEQRGRILETKRKIEPTVKRIRSYRNQFAFHGRKDLHVNLGMRREFLHHLDEVNAAMNEFLRLATELKPHEAPFQKEIKPALKKAFPQVSDAGLEKLEDYFSC